MAATAIWQEEFTVKSSETDFQARLKLSNFFTWMQDVATNHADHLGVGFHDLQKQEMAWVLSRKKIRFLDFPRMGEKVTVQTWPKGIQQKLFFMRDHELSGADGRQLALSTTAYVLVSTRARRILPSSMLDMPIPDNGGRSAIAEPLDKIPAVEGMSECLSVQAGYSMIDLMGHVNNVRYIDWLCDCFPIDEYQDRRPDWLQINYINEIKPGEKVSLLRGPYPDRAGSWYVTGLNQTSGAKAFEAAIQWQPYQITNG
jgi:medium-chain acyl-[acyl-carrier-protein] hydrolase